MSGQVRGRAHGPDERPGPAALGKLSMPNNCRYEAVVTHDEAVAEICRLATALEGAAGDRDSAIAALSSSTLSSTHAALRLDLAAIAFGWALLRKIGRRSFPSHFVLRPPAEDERAVMHSRSHIFTAALDIAVRTLEAGYAPPFTKAAVEYLCGLSPEVRALNQALDAEPDFNVAEGEFSPPVLFGYTMSDFEAAS